MTNLADTKAFAVCLANALKSGDVVRLDGEMGAGKTTLVQFYAEAAGSTDDVTSPTFSIVRTYDASDGSIHHLDLYRLDAPEELEQIEYEDYFYPDAGITFVEWAERAEDYLPRDVIRIFLRRLEGDQREIVIADDTERGREVLAEMEHCL